MKHQGTTESDIAETRVPRSVLFLVCSIFYGVILAFRLNGVKLPYQVWFGSWVLVLSVLITAFSIVGLRITSKWRFSAFILLAWILAILLYFNFRNGQMQAASLLLYLTGNCWIEVWLGFKVLIRERG